MIYSRYHAQIQFDKTNEAQETRVPLGHACEKDKNYFFSSAT